MRVWLVLSLTAFTQRHRLLSAWSLMLFSSMHAWLRRPVPGCPVPAETMILETGAPKPQAHHRDRGRILYNQNRIRIPHVIILKNKWTMKKQRCLLLMKWARQCARYKIFLRLNLSSGTGPCGQSSIRHPWYYPQIDASHVAWKNTSYLSDTTKH